MDLCPPDHDYCSTPEPGDLDLALSAYKDLQEKHTMLLKEMEQLTVGSKFSLERFAASDEDIRFYTRFACSST